MKLFVFGYGYTGREIVRRGVGVNASVTLRSPEAVEVARKAGVDVYRFDGRSWDEPLPSALARADVLLMTAAPGPDGDPALAAFADVIAAAPELRRIVYLSTIGVYAETGGAWIDETAPTNHVSPRAVHRLEAERRWRELGAAMGIPVDILRLAGIYGPGRNAILKLREGKARRIVKPGQVFNRIHVEDIARAFWRLVERDGPGDIWNVADEEPAPPQDVFAFAAALIGVPAPPEEDFATADMTPMARAFYEGNRRVSIEKLKRELGHEPRYPTYREGLRALSADGGSIAQARVER